MTIAEIIGREVAAANAALGLTRKDGAVHLACSRVAKAVVEEAAKVIEPLKLFRPEIVGAHQPSKWRNAAIDLAQEAIRALAAQGPGGGES